MMQTHVFNNGDELGRAAAEQAALALRAAIARQGHARFIAATGASQFAFLAALLPCN
jgi:glucosamine-6-phosphate deaminase